MFVVVGTVDFRAPHLRTRLNGVADYFLDKGNVEAPHKIMQLFTNEFLAVAEFWFSKRFETTPNVGTTGRGSKMGFVLAVVTVTAISESFKITKFHGMGSDVDGEVLYSQMRVGKFEVSAIYGVRHGVTGMVLGSMVMTMTLMLVRMSVSALSLSIRGNRLGINGSREAEKTSVSNEGLGDHYRLKYE